MRGSLVGNRLSFNFETAWSWLNVHEIGSAALDISADGASLTGPVLIGGKPGRWTLTRTKAATRPPPPPAPTAPPSYTPLTYNGGYGGHGGFGGGGGGGGAREGFASYHDRIVKEVSEGFNDPVKMERLKKRADVEPELRELLERRHVLPRRK